MLLGRNLVQVGATQALRTGVYCIQFYRRLSGVVGVVLSVLGRVRLLWERFQRMDRFDQIFMLFHAAATGVCPPLIFVFLMKIYPNAFVALIVASLIFSLNLIAYLRPALLLKGKS